MLTTSILSASDSICQKHTLLSKKYTLLASAHIPGSPVKMAMREVAPASDVVLLQSLLAAYDHNTNAHAQRIVFLAEATAYQLHLSDEEIFVTILAALLHDVGKAGIPKAILNKSGPLDEQERRIMCRHPEIGQQMLMLAGSIFMSLAPIVKAHHEDWDGGGYPLGLVGEEIPLAARIIAVVDSYDAMTWRRVYHEPQSVVESCMELQRCAGSRYDPHVVAAFLSSLEGLLEICGQRTKRNPATNVTESAGAKFAMPSLQSGGCVPVSA